MTADIPLGRATAYPEHYLPGLLYAIPRTEGRAALGLSDPLPFQGCDLWTAWELTWLDPNGVPKSAIADISVAADSPNIIESKSLKLYLNSFSMTSFASSADVRAAVAKDLSELTDSDTTVRLLDSSTAGDSGPLDGVCVDSTDAACDTYEVDPELLVSSEEVVSESLHSHLLRSLCPVTSQPDIGSVLVTYTGPKISNAGLLRYIVSYRRHKDFHESCVERMFIDILAQCQPEKLSVYARYQRRGGIDINPFRSNHETGPPNIRIWRQ